MTKIHNRKLEKNWAQVKSTYKVLFTNLFWVRFINWEAMRAITAVCNVWYVIVLIRLTKANKYHRHEPINGLIECRFDWVSKFKCMS